MEKKEPKMKVSKSYKKKRERPLTREQKRSTWK